MSPSRRDTLALAAAAMLAACARHRLVQPVKGRLLDIQALKSGFPGLAARAAPAVFALGVMDLRTTTAWYSDTQHSFPLGTAAAAPIAAAALAELDAGRLSLTEPVTFDALDLSSPASRLAADWPDPPDRRTGAVAAGELFRLALLDRDATAIDLLCKRIGGPGAVDGFLDLKQVQGLRVDRYQREIAVAMYGMPSFRAAWAKPAAFEAARQAVPPPARRAAMVAYIRDPRDTTSVPAALGFLDMLAAGELISAASTARLLALMADVRGGRFAPGLPHGATAAVALGAAAPDLDFEPAVSELAIVTAPAGRRYALAGFLTGSSATAEARAALFADAARLAAKAFR